MHIEQNFHFVAGVMPQGWDLGGVGGSKTLVWGFAMGPHRLCILTFSMKLHLLTFLDLSDTKSGGGRHQLLYKKTILVIQMFIW